MCLDFFTKADIQTDISRIEELLQTEIFLPANIRHPLCKSAFIELLICLRDLMYKAEKYSSRINFDDDVLKTDKILDVTDLIKFIRDSLCHPDIPHHYLVKGKIKATYNITFGKCNIIQYDDIIIKSDYEDDICFFFGEQKIYFKRHILRAFKEAKEKLLPLL